MKQDIRYTPTDVFDTFPLPELGAPLEQLSVEIDSVRREAMIRRGFGLTALYNQVHDPSSGRDEQVTRVRALHVELDSAVMAAYGWEDVALNYGFHTHGQMVRWTVSPAVRIEILDRLLELNHERARSEGQNVPDQNPSDGQEALFL